MLVYHKFSVYCDTAALSEAIGKLGALQGCLDAGIRNPPPPLPLSASEGGGANTPRRRQPVFEALD